MMRGLWIRGLKTIAVALLLANAAFSQNPQKTDTIPEQKQPVVNVTADTYRLDIVIRELQDGKVISSRSYSGLAKEGERHDRARTIKIGSRLPVQSGPQGMNYLDVGTNLDFRVWKMEGQLILAMTLEVSSVAPTDSTSTTKLTETPILRQFRIDQEAAIPLGKPTLLDSLDDPNSNHKFQIEVTATKEKV
jgi:hypothetical protein